MLLAYRRCLGVGRGVGPACRRCQLISARRSARFRWFLLASPLLMESFAVVVFKLCDVKSMLILLLNSRQSSVFILPPLPEFIGATTIIQIVQPRTNGNVGRDVPAQPGTDGPQIIPLLLQHLHPPHETPKSISTYSIDISSLKRSSLSRLFAVSSSTRWP